MKVTFKKLILHDFKGIRDFSIEFNKDVTEIFGDNGVGKTTLLDALYWVFFGKNSLGNSKFDLFPLDEEENLIPNTSPTVTLLMEVDGKDIEISRNKTKTSTGYIDGIPRAIKEYEAYINEIINEKVFMALINPVFFGLNYTWSEQRKLILDNLEIDDVVIDRDEFTDIKVEVQTYGVDLVISKYKKKVKDLETSITKAQGEKEYITKSLAGRKCSEDKDNLMVKKQQLNNTLKSFEGAQKIISKLEDDKMFIERKMRSVESDKSDKVNSLTRKKNELTHAYKAKKAALNLIKDNCTLCGAPLNKAEVQKQREEIQLEIDSIINSGKTIGAEIETLSKTDVTLDLQTELKDVMAKIVETNNAIDNETMTSLFLQRDEIESQIQDYETVFKLTQDLKKTSDLLKSESIELDKNKLLLEKVKKYYDDSSQHVTEQLNKLLEKIQIKTLELKKDGEYKSIFSITMDGVPYKSVNRAGKTIAGIELIQLLNKSLDIDFPIVVDNREGITSDIVVPNQLITLYAKKGAELGV